MISSADFTGVPPGGGRRFSTANRTPGGASTAGRGEADGIVSGRSHDRQRAVFMSATGQLMAVSGQFVVSAVISLQRAHMWHKVRNASPSMGVAAGEKYVGRHWSPLGPAGARGGTHVGFVHDGQEVNEMATNTTSRTLALAAVGLMVAATTAACGSSSTGSSSTGSSSSTAVTVAETGVIAGLDYGPLVGLIGTWKSAPNGGVDVAPGQAGSKVGKGKPAVSPYYETITYTPAGGAVNASEQHLTALY